MNHVYNKGIIKYTQSLINVINEKYTIDQIKTDDLYIGVSHPNELAFYHDFKNITHLLDCCMGSSFIPGITHNKLLYFYNQRYTVDGGLWFKHYKKYIDFDKTLVISPRMFNRYNRTSIIVDGLFNKKLSLYQLYINGYNDARKNHKYLSRFLKERKSKKTNYSSS